jgi:hypothetical protein
VPKSTTESSEIVDEAMRAISSASRKTAEDTRAVVDATRSTIDEAVALNRKFVSGVTSGLEANLRASFAIQTALLTASQSVVDAAVAANKATATKWLEVNQQNQETILEAWQAGASLYSRFPVLSVFTPFVPFEK